MIRFFQTHLQSKIAETSYLLGRCLLAGVFLWSGLSKAYAPNFFAETIAAYGLLPDPLVFPAALLLIVAELLFGVGLLIDQRGALAGIGLLLLLFMAVLGYGISLGLDVDCGCFGPNDPEAAAFHDLHSVFIRDLLLLLVILYLYCWRFANRPQDGSRDLSRRIVAKEA